MKNCPQCGQECEQLHEGYCKDCCDENQKNLDSFNARHDWWNGLTQREKGLAIKRVYE